MNRLGSYVTKSRSAWAQILQVATEFGMVHHHDPECHVKSLGQGHSEGSNAQNRTKTSQPFE